MLPVGSKCPDLLKIAVEFVVAVVELDAVVVKLDMLYTSCCLAVRLDVVVVAAIPTVVCNSYLYPLDHYFDCSQIVVET